MSRSGWWTKTSTRAVLLPSEVGVSQPLFSGSPRKNGAPSTVIPTTPPRFHNSFAPIAFAYHCAAADASETASITEMTGSRASFAMANFLSGLTRTLEEQVVGVGPGSDDTCMVATACRGTRQLTRAAIRRVSRRANLPHPAFAVLIHGTRWGPCTSLPQFGPRRDAGRRTVRRLRSRTSAG